MKRIAAISIIILILFTSGCISDNNAVNTEKNQSTTSGNNRIATIVTEKGTIKFELYEKEAPITTKIFISVGSKGGEDPSRQVGDESSPLQL
jgi:PBP1b-binding outer membrane lipoprotein LpoB